MEVANGQRPRRARSFRQQHTGLEHASYVASYRCPSSLRRAEQCSIVGECRRPTQPCSEPSPACGDEVSPLTEGESIVQAFRNRPSNFYFLGDDGLGVPAMPMGNGMGEGWNRMGSRSDNN